MKEVLFIVDMNNGFCNNGNLADPDIKKIIPNIINWVTIYRMRGAQIVNVNDKHTEGSVLYHSASLETAPRTSNSIG